MYTLKQAAEKLGVSIVTLRRYIKQGKLTANKVGKEYRVAEADVEALRVASTPTNPDEIIDQALETNDDYRFEHQRSDAFSAAEKILRERGDTKKADTIAKDALIFGYRLIVQSRAEKSKNTNRGRFSPRMTGTDAAGKPAAWPDPAWIDSDLVEHAKIRAANVNNPVTKAVYCDLVYEYSKNADRPKYGKLAVDAYLQAADIEPEDTENFRYFNTQSYILRALELSLALKDDALFDKTKNVALRKMEELAANGQPRISHEIIEDMLRQAKKLNRDDIKRIEPLINTGAQYYFDEGNQHLGRSFVELRKLLPAVKGDDAKQKAIQRELYDSFIREGVEKSASGMVAAHFYTEALKIGGGVISADEQAELRRKIEDGNLQGESEMKSFSYDFTIKNEDIKKYVDAILRDDNEESLKRIALLPGMMPSMQHAEKLAKELLEKYPVSQMFGRSSLQDGRVVAITSGGSELTEDHILSRLNEDIQMHGMWLGFLFDELKKRGLDAPSLAAFLSQRDLFPNEVMPAISEALANYFEGRYYSAVTVLLTQLEQLLRLANRKLGLPTLRSLDNGEQRVIYLNEALSNLKDVFDGLSPDAYQYFSLVLLDKRGLGLRDTTAHGLLEFNSSNKNQANILVQLLLILAVFQYEQKDSDGKQDTSRR
ncbi:MAG: helix-turn-helix domain-containing protein [Actinomycetota bacterium]